MKKFIISVFAFVMLGIAGAGIYSCAIPDYVKQDEIFKGYTDCTGYNNTGKDIDIYYVYSYSEEQIEKFSQSDLYKKVDEKNIDEVRKMIKWYEEFNGHENFSETVSAGDYYILRYLDHNGNEIEEFDDYFVLYYFDVQSQKLYYLAQSI